MTYPAQVQHKLNGLRATYENGHFVTGDGVIWHDNVVAHILEPLNHYVHLLGLDQFNVKLDGEFYRHGWPLQKINQFIGVKNLEARPETSQISFNVFDMNSIGSFTMRNMAVDTLLKKLFQIGGFKLKLKLKKVDTQWVKDESDADDYFVKSIALGYEGCVYRLSATPKGKQIKNDTPRDQWSKLPDKKRALIDFGYVEGVRPHWMLKRKEADDAEYKIVGMEEGKVTAKGGKHVGRMGALICITAQGRKFNVGGGFSDAQREHYWKNSPVGKKLRVKYGRLSENRIPVEPRAFDGELREYA